MFVFQFPELHTLYGIILMGLGVLSHLLIIQLPFIIDFLLSTFNTLATN